MLIAVDGDLLQLVDKSVHVLMPAKGLKNMKLFGIKDVEEKLGFGPEMIADYKGICGDASDNIPGVKGIGEKGATKLIQKFKSVENIYKTLEENGDFLRQEGFTARILNNLADHKHEAFLSRDLAYIHRDAPIIIPKMDSWRDKIVIEEVRRRFKELELESILSAVLEQSGLSNTKEKENAGEEKPGDFNRACIMAWILDSDIINPTKEEILAFTDTTSVSNAIKALEFKLQSAGLTSVWFDIEFPLVKVIEKMEGIGIKLDLKHMGKLETEMAQDISTISKDIYKIAKREFNISSPKQLGEVLYDDLRLGKKTIKKTSKGSRSTKESALLNIVDESPIVPLVLKFRHLSKLLNTYIVPFCKMVDKNERIHTTLIQNGTTTGRMSSRNPNIQNIPTRTDKGRDIRNAFIAQEGYSLVSFDYEQIELRIAAIMSKDSALLKILESGRDIHSETAALMFKVDIENVSDDMRRQAKSINFGILYGMGHRSLAKSMGEGFKSADAEKFLEDYKITFSGLISFLERTKREARMHGYTETLFNRRRNIRDINSSISYIQSQAERFAINAPIQGTGADIIKIAMIRIDESLSKDGAEDVKMLLQVHDELLFEIKKGSEEKISPIQKIMEDILLEKDILLPLTVSVKIGQRWGDMRRI